MEENEIVTKLSNLTADQLVGLYKKVEAKLDIKKGEYEAETKPLKAAMDAIKLVLMRELLDKGITSAKTDHGTAYMTTITNVTAPDWGAFIEWVRDTGQYNMLERRPAKKELLQFIEDSEGSLPPGVQVSSIRKLNIRGK